MNGAARQAGASAEAPRPELLVPSERMALQHRLARDIAARLALSGDRRAVRVALTRNRSRLVSWSADARSVELRLHEVLGSLATSEDLDAVAGFVLRRPGARERLRAFLSRHAKAVARVSGSPQRKTRARLVTRGQWHDLAEILEEVRSVHFPDLHGVLVTWSARSGSPRRHIRLGSWSRAARLVRIHRRLDSRHVPRFFVASIVHHELCHAALGTAETDAPRRAHGPEFRALERAFPDLERARAWERANKRLLLTP